MAENLGLGSLSGSKGDMGARFRKGPEFSVMSVFKLDGSGVCTLKSLVSVDVEGLDVLNNFCSFVVIDELKLTSKLSHILENEVHSRTSLSEIDGVIVEKNSKLIGKV